MASKVLYPAIVSDYQAAFIATEKANVLGNYCRVYFSLSKFNASQDFLTVQATVKKQDNGLSVVKKTENRMTGIILNLTPVYDEETQQFYVDIYDKDLKSSCIVNNTEYKGWIPGWIYKIQLRLSTIAYEGESNATAQYSWLNTNANSFSEWSTICIIKCIGDILIKIPAYNHFNSLTNSLNNNKSVTLTISSLSLNGTFSSPIDISEFLYNYEVTLIDKKTNEILETSGSIFAERQINEQVLKYNFKTFPEQNKQYIIKLSITTNNLYKKVYNFDVTYLASVLNTTPKIAVLTIDGYYEEQIAENINVYTPPLSTDKREHSHIVKPLNNIDEITTIDEGTQAIKYYKTIMEKYTSLSKEEEEGYVCLKLYLAKGANPIYNTNIIVKRSCSKDGFTTWEDFKIIPFNGLDLESDSINDLPLLYDYTIESGIIYKYAVQIEDKYGNRSSTYNKGCAEIVRYFEHSYLLGENGQQLKIKFDDAVTAYKTNLLEQKTDTLGSQYSVYTRNGIVKYRTLAIGGLVSFNMDENNTFITKNKLYFGKDMHSLYESYNIKNNIDKIYDNTHERLFREAVMDFLHDGKPKLYKSPTEGNIIVRMMDINFTPNQQLGRLVYSFVGNANEYDTYNLENCIKNNFHILGEPSKIFTNTTFKVGQTRLLPIKTVSNNETVGGIGTVTSGTDIVPLIFNTYNYYGQNIAGLRYKVNGIYGLKIEVFNDRQSLGQSNYQIGYKMYYNDIEKNNPIYVINNEGVYYFDEKLVITQADTLVLESLDGTDMEILLDFIYELSIENFEDKVPEQTSYEKKVGQFADFIAPGTSIYNAIFDKYYFDTDTNFRRLFDVWGVCIEANPGTVFEIGIAGDGDERHNIIINDTGYYNFYDLDEITSLVLVKTSEGYTRKEIDFGTNVIVNYICDIAEGTYRQEA